MLLNELGGNQPNENTVSITEEMAHYPVVVSSNHKWLYYSSEFDLFISYLEVEQFGHEPAKLCVVTFLFRQQRQPSVFGFSVPCNESLTLCR